MSAIEGWNGHLIFPAEIMQVVQRDPAATVKVLRKTRTRLYLQVTVPAMHLRDAVIDLRRDGDAERAALACAGAVA